VLDSHELLEVMNRLSLFIISGNIKTARKLSRGTTNCNTRFSV